MVKHGALENLSLPNHRELPKGILRKSISKAGLTRYEFVDLLNRLEYARQTAPHSPHRLRYRLPVVEDGAARDQNRGPRLD